MIMQNKQNVCAIVAVGPDNVVGKNGVMPWYCKSDFYHFKKLTVPNPCVFGRTTFENLPIAPLPNRFNLVCSTRYKNEYKDGVFYANSVESALKECANYSTVFICGGAQIYKYTFEKDLIDILYLTVIKNSYLKQNIQKNPELYSRFYLDVSAFFDSPKWHVEQIVYSPNEIPKDINNTTAEFFKCCRVR